ncbi:MAG: hypothetical protein ACIAQZ_09630 [Sedimentisphaeraceae bacterium JB056]
MFFSIEHRIDNFKQFYARNNTKPLFGFFAESEYPLFRYRSTCNLPTDRPLSPDDFVVDDLLGDYDRLFDLHEQAGGDFIFAASSFWGIPWLEAALGCEIFADHSTGSIYAKHPESLSSVNLEYSSDNGWVKKGVEFLDKLAAHSNGRFPLATPRLRGISDLLACIYGDENLVFKFFEDAEHIKELCTKLTDYWISFAAQQLEHIPDFHGGIGSFYYHNWAPAGTVWLQEDASSILSPDIYSEFILPCVEKQIAAFNGCITHMHPTGFYPYKQLVDTDMLALELHIDEGGPGAKELFGVHKEILAKKPLIIWGAITEEDLDFMFDNLPPQGLAIALALNNQQMENKENERLYRKYKQ